jgi:hypothetical protein
VLAGREFADMICNAVLPALTRKSSHAWHEISQQVRAGFVFDPELKAQAAAFARGVKTDSAAAERLSKALGRPLEAGDVLMVHAFPDLASSGRVPLGGCSSFSAWGKNTADGEVVSGRNLDYFTFAAVMPQMIIAQEPSEAGRQRTIEVSVPGFFGASTVLNESGVFLALHDEPGLDGGAEGGWVPRVWPLRGAIERAKASSAVEDVAGALRGTKLALGANVHLSFPVSGNRGGAPAVLEWDGNPAEEGVTVRTTSTPHASAIFCTNHYLKRRKRNADGSTAQRFRAMTEGVGKTASAGGTIDVEAAKRLLDTAAVRGEGSTYLSVIAKPATRELWVAVAPRAGASATDGEWTHVRWEEVFGKN